MKKKIRNLKIASVLRRAISKVLMEGRVFNKNVVISDVKLSEDLKKADVYVVLSSLNKKDYNTNTIVKEINQSAWLIRKSMLSYVNLRFIPKLVFKADLAFDNFVNISKG
ncbi:ribosome-binding factor A [Wolbachia endosymbiont of Litomosoides brasiliensis]|uniref:ribosome-binding factor A n=1 Tax=Wolbachia endosymbiont of Litomosoides brasiliensis TaxID=1812117 RepID=UPI0015889227|nr:ribosome-binding factor A [Wolbachia endosymbiont of Litomosoides brasiliensis]NUY39154.1 ribosome-binding factor A [Wolbachia endosymbiont of Litomosoides brasiliensis]